MDVKLHIATKVKGASGVVRHEFAGRGTVHQKGDITYVQYEENLDEIGKVRQFIKITKDELIIHRKGAVSMRQQFFTGKETHGVYETSFGRIPFVLKTNRWQLQWDEKKERGTLTVDYEMTLAESEKQKHELAIKIWKAGM